MLTSSTYNPSTYASSSSPMYITSDSTESTSSPPGKLCEINDLILIYGSTATLTHYHFILRAGSAVLPVGAGASIVLVVVIAIVIFVVLLVIIIR